MCHVELALADRLHGRLDDAERGFPSSIVRWRAGGERSSAVSVCDYLGQVRIAQGRLDAAFGTYQMALEIAHEPGRQALPCAGIAYAGMAKVEYQRDELDAALEHVSPPASPVSGRPATPPRWPPVWPGCPESGRPPATRLARWRLSARPSRSRPAQPWVAWSIPCRCSGRGCCWPRATSPRPPAGPNSTALAGSANPAPKLLTVIAGMCTGADSIDDLDMLRAGATSILFDGVYAPSTLGTLLREFSFGHARQLESVLREHLVTLAKRTEVLAGIGQQAFIVIDSLLRPVYGHAKQGASLRAGTGPDPLAPARWHLGTT